MHWRYTCIIILCYINYLLLRSRHYLETLVKLKVAEKAIQRNSKYMICKMPCHKASFMTSGFSDKNISYKHHHWYHLLLTELQKWKGKLSFFVVLRYRQLFRSKLSKHEPCAFVKYACLISPFPLLLIQLELESKQ